MNSLIYAKLVTLKKQLDKVLSNVLQTTLF